MFRRGLSILGAHLLKKPGFRFHALTKTIKVQPCRLTGLPIKMFATNLPKHQVLNMPALSPTMATGKVVKWYKKVGDPIVEGDVLCDVQTDKATVGFEMLDKGFIAKILLKGEEQIKVGQPVVVIVTKKEDVAAFENYSAGGGEQKEASQPKAKKSKQQAEDDSTGSKKQASGEQPASKGKKGKAQQEPEKAQTEDADKAEGQTAQRPQKKNKDAQESNGSPSKNKKGKAQQEPEKAQAEDAQKLEGQTAQKPQKKKQATQDNDNAASKGKKGKAQQEPEKEEVEEGQEAQGSAAQKPQKKKKDSDGDGDRVVASPLAKKTAQESNVDLQSTKGSGPGGRIIKQDVEQSQKQPAQQKASKETTKAPQPTKKKGPSIPDNPVEEIPLTSIRKVIAARLIESKTTIPHYYAQVDINMDRVIQVREELNVHEKEFGVKISINDFIMRACALASRDYPDVNVQWGDKVIKKFKYVDLAMAVATDKGLITPIIFRADTKGLLDIARASKDLAKRARQSKLLPHQFQGGTCSVSNLGMYGVTSITSIINPPHSLILGVGKSQKRIVYFEDSKDESKPYKVANMMTVVASADHRVVDGALAGQWIVRVKKYLESPIHMLL